MYIRKVAQQKFDLLKRNLDICVPREPMEVAYHTDIKANNILYRLRLHLCDHHRVLPLQAVRLHSDFQKCELITDPVMLGALTELVLAQYSVEGCLSSN